jgi:hypothetical protein
MTSFSLRELLDLRTASAAILAGVIGLASTDARAQSLLDGGFETQAVAQNLPSYSTGPNGELWGRPWNAGWTPAGLESSWRGIAAGSPWVGGAIARTEDFATGWKWAKTGVVFGIIKDRQQMQQTFTASQNAIGTLTWFDCNRNSWRGDTWFGRPNDYSVTVTDNLGNVQVIGNYTSQVFGGLESNSWANLGDDRFTLPNKQGWFTRTGATVHMVAGRTYTLSFNSLSPYILDNLGNITGVDDRTTLLDDIALTSTVVPSANHQPYGMSCATPAFTLSAAPAPISTPTTSTTVVYSLDNIPLASPAPAPAFHFGVLAFSLTQDVLGTDLTAYGIDAPGCKLYIASIDSSNAFVGTTPNQTLSFIVPSAVPGGLIYYAQAAALISPVPTNNAGIVVSNAVRSYIDSY